MHAEKFRKLEGSWRGLKYLISNSGTCDTLKIRVLHLSKEEIAKYLSKGVEFDQSQLFKRLYEREFDQPEGEPYGAMIGDYEFDNSPEDVELLIKISEIAAASFCPFIASAGSRLLGLETWQDLSQPIDFEEIAQSDEYIKWRNYRETDEAKFVVLTAPRTLARLPYGKNTWPVRGFRFEELNSNKEGHLVKTETNQFCWMNTAYVLGFTLARAYTEHGWCTSIHGYENGGKLDNLPTFAFPNEHGDLDRRCPTEIGIAYEVASVLPKLGLQPLCHFKDADFACFFVSQTTHKAKKYDRLDARANAAIAARLPYVMATSRIAHYIKVIARDSFAGGRAEAKELECSLNRWIQNYCNTCESNNPEAKAQYRFRTAKVEVADMENQPGTYNVVAHLWPRLSGVEELTTPLPVEIKIHMN